MHFSEEIGASNGAPFIKHMSDHVFHVLPYPPTKAEFSQADIVQRGIRKNSRTPQRMARRRILLRKGNEMRLPINRHTR